MGSRKTYCYKGHAFTEENTTTDSTGRRRCLQCTRDRNRRYRERNREKERRRHYLAYWGNGAYRERQLEKGRERQAKIRASLSHQERREARLKYLYKMSESDFQEISQKQRRRCAICQKVPRKCLVIDHDHSNGVVRGLLCTRCNTGLGKFSDSPALLRRAIKHLEYHHNEQNDKRPHLHELYAFDPYIKQFDKR